MPKRPFGPTLLAQRRFYRLADQRAQSSLWYTHPASSGGRAAGPAATFALLVRCEAGAPFVSRRNRACRSPRTIARQSSFSRRHLVACGGFAVLAQRSYRPSSLKDYGRSAARICVRRSKLVSHPVAVIMHLIGSEKPECLTVIRVPASTFSRS
jgi:hypothetical protein